MAKELTQEQVLHLFPPRNPFVHKGMCGKTLLLCGSIGYTGAAALAALSALRTGAGLVYLGVPESIYPIEAAKLLEPIVFPLPDRGGMLSPCAVKKIRTLLLKVDSVLIGPGLGCSRGTFKVLQYVLKNFRGPVVIDADGINLLAPHKDILRGRTGSTILTPHEGEFARIGGNMELTRVDGAEKLAKELGVIVLRKGAGTVITDGTETYINPTGNPGMAVGGSGDVLSGVICSLLGKGVTPLMAAAAGAWIHGAAGDLCEKEFGQYGMIPGDMINALPRLLK